MRGIHAAERQVISARHAAERRAVIEAGRTAAGSQRDLARRLLASKYADRLARVLDSGDAQAAWAARERLKLEEAIEGAQLDLAHQRSESDGIRSALSGLRIRQRVERHGLAQSHRRQRVILGVILTARRRGPAAGPPAPDTGTRQVEDKRPGYRSRQRRPLQ